MKKYFKSTVSLILCLLIFTDCEKKLDLQPLGQLGATSFYKNERDFDAASLSPYSSLLNLFWNQDGNGWYRTQLLPDDDIVVGNNESNQIEDFVWNSGESEFRTIWEESYKGIMRANVILDRLPDAPDFNNVANKARYEGEARFLRAFFHFILTLNFGNVPIAKEFVQDFAKAKTPSSQAGEVWDFIIEDLKFAKDNLPPSYSGLNVGRATTGAASALLGKVYLYRAQWENNPAYYAQAISEFNAVLAGPYSLTPKFADNFDLKKENNSESIFEVQFTRGDFNTWLSTDFGIGEDQNVGHAASGRKTAYRPGCYNGKCAPGANSHGYGKFHITPSLQAEFEPGDPRRVETIFIQGDEFGKDDKKPDSTRYFRSEWSVTGSTPAKYIKQEGITEAAFPPNYTTNNERLIRLADVMLMKAEAELLGNSNVAAAAALINQVRRRADPSGLVLPDRSSGATVAQMFEWLRHERRVELALEGNRYNDLVRWHRAGLINIRSAVNFGRPTANTNWSEKNLIKPIPQSELDVNDLVSQNVEYR